jgi:hypothetical protein
MSEVYDNNYTDLKIKCACGNIFYTRFDTFKSKFKRQCNECTKKNYKAVIYNYEQVKEFIDVKSESGCILASKTYGHPNDNLDIICKCGNHFTTTFYRFLRYKRRQCDSCGRKSTGLKTRNVYDEVKRFIEIDSQSGCKLLTKSIENGNQKLQLECACGRVFEASYNKFLHRYQRQCKHCSKKISLGEKEIMKYLNNNNITYIYQYKMDDCRDTNCLPFDFAIFHNNKLYCLIEFQGEQHFRPVSHWGKKDLRSNKEEMR